MRHFEAEQADKSTKPSVRRPSTDERLPPTASAILELQRTAGNATVNRVLGVQRFATKSEYDFAGAKRAQLPPSVDLTPMPGKSERHHIVGDRSILKWLGKKKAGEAVPVNKWAAAALDSEVRRATAAIEATPEEERDDPKVVRNKNTLEKAYVPLAAKFGDGPVDETTPELDNDDVEYVLTVLEWSPNNFVIDKEARKFDPGDALDIEALLLKGNIEMRTLLLKIAVAMGEIEEPQLEALDEAFKGTKNEAKWAELRAEVNDPGNVSDLFAQLVVMDPALARGEMKPSKTGKKQKLDSKGWEKALVKNFAKT